MVRIIWLTILAGAICLSAGCEGSSQSGSTASNDAPVAGTVSLEIDFKSDRKNIQVDVPCSSDSTVYSILERAQNMGDLSFKSSGQSDPSMTFVGSIAGVDNLAGAGDNWIYLVNDKLGDKSAASYPVRPGDEIKWVFGKYDPE